MFVGMMRTSFFFARQNRAHSAIFRCRRWHGNLERNRRRQSRCGNIWSFMDTLNTITALRKLNKLSRTLPKLSTVMQELQTVHKNQIYMFIKKAPNLRTPVYVISRLCLPKLNWRDDKLQATNFFSSKCFSKQIVRSLREKMENILRASIVNRHYTTISMTTSAR